MGLSCIFVFAPSFIRVDLSTIQPQHPRASLSFLNSFGPYCYFLNLQKVILHIQLPGVTSDIIMSVLHESFMFFASLSILDVLLVSFHRASSRFLRFLAVLTRTSSDWSRGFSSCYHSKMGKHIANSSSLTSSLFLHLQCLQWLSFHSFFALYTPT